MTYVANLQTEKTNLRFLSEFTGVLLTASNMERALQVSLENSPQEQQCTIALKFRL